MTKTPTTMIAIPKIAGKSNFCLKNMTEIKAVRTIPKPAQMAYATPKGISRMANENR